MTTDEEYRERAANLENLLRFNPELHDQTLFGAPTHKNACNTTACVAGWATLVDEGLVEIQPDGSPVFTGLHSLTLANPWGDDEEYCTLYDSALLDNAFNRGADYLGLSGYRAEQLFLDTMDREAALDILHGLATGEISRDAANAYDDDPYYDEPGYEEDYRYGDDSDAGTF